MKDIAMFKRYLKDISKYKLISRDDEIELSKKIMNGENESIKTLTNANLKLVVKISIEYYKGSISIMDIIQNGNIGLMKAAKRYNHNKGVKFSTYAAFWIKQSILRGFIKPTHNINISFRKDMIDKKIKNYIKDEIEKTNRFPSIYDIMDEVKVSRRDAVDVLFYFKSSEYSLNEIVFEEGDEIIDNIADDKFNPEKLIEENLLNNDVMSVVESYSPRERDIIKKRYGFDNTKKETLQKLGNKYSITAEAARQIEKRVLLHMRNKFPYLSYYFYSN